MVLLGCLVVGVVYEFNNLISFVYGNMYVLCCYIDKFSVYFDVVVQGESCDNLCDMCE